MVSCVGAAAVTSVKLAKFMCYDTSYIMENIALIPTVSHQFASQSAEFAPSCGGRRARREAMIKQGKILVYLRATPGGKLLDQTILELRNPDGSALPISKILQKVPAPTAAMPCAIYIM